MRHALLVIAIVLALRVPYLNHPIQGDDVYYLVSAQHAQIDPAHPLRAKFAFEGQMVSMQGHPHGPFNAWYLGALTALFGDIKEVPFHAAYLPFSLIAALSALSLARRFTPHPLTRQQPRNRRPPARLLAARHGPLHRQPPVSRHRPARPRRPHGVPVRRPHPHPLSL